MGLIATLPCSVTAGDTLQAVDGALQALVPCALPYGLDPALQPQGWLSGRCRVVREPASGTLWVGVAAAAEPGGGAAAADAPSHEAFKERENEAARALLAAFLTSHTVLWLASSGRGQVLPRVSDLLQRLRLLQQLKGALLPALPALLGVAPSEAGPAVPGFCIPQLFVLAQPPAAASARGSASTALAAEVAAAAPSAALPTEAARAAAERQLRLLLKRCRVLLPEDNARALCALPSAAPAVLCLPERLGSGSQEHLVADALAELALPGPAGPAVQQAQQGKPSAAAVVAAALAPQHAAVAATGGAQTWHTTLTSLAATLEAAALKAAGTPSEQPAADVAVPSEAAAAAAWQLACSDSVRQFSLASCKRAAAVASDAYRRNTPDLLPAGGHAVAAAAALRLYRSLARGPAAADGAAALRQQLDDYWRAGHQQCEAVSLLGNPCCLPVHDPQQQPHTSIADAAKPLLLLATGSGGQQQRIPEPFTVAELQQAAAAVAAESASAAARVQLWVRRLGGAGVSSSATGAPAGRQAAETPAAGAALEDDEDAAAGDRRRLSGGGRGSDDEAEGHPAELSAAVGDAGAEASAAAARAAALGSPAAGCWLEMHVLGPRSMYKSAALSAALLMDGQPGWLRAGGCMFAQLPLLVAVPGKPGQQPAPTEQQEAQAPAAEEFPSLAEVKQHEQRRRRPPATAKQQRKEQEVAASGAPAEPQQPRLLDWPGWQGASGTATAAASAGTLPRPGAANRQPRRQPVQQRGGQQQQPQQAAGTAPAAGTEQHMLLLGFEYESVAGQRLLLTPALLAAAVQSSLDTVSVRQHGPAATVAVGPGPQTAAAAAAAATVPPTGAAAFLLQRDLPLWLQLPGEQLAQLAGKRRGPAGGASGSDRPVWVQLRRLLVSTPDVAIQLEALPELLVEVPSDMLAPPSSAPQQPGSSSSGGSSSSPASVQLAYRLAAPLALPPSSFCVLALPWLLTAPMGQPGGGGSTSSGTPTALIRQSGPLRAVLSAGTALRPAAVSAPP